MKNAATAGFFCKGLSVLYPDDFNWKDAGVDTSNLDEDELSCQMQSWKAFVDESSSLYIKMIGFSHYKWASLFKKIIL